MPLSPPPPQLAAAEVVDRSQKGPSVEQDVEQVADGMVRRGHELVADRPVVNVETTASFGGRTQRKGDDGWVEELRQPDAMLLPESLSERCPEVRLAVANNGAAHGQLDDGRVFRLFHRIRLPT